MRVVIPSHGRADTIAKHTLLLFPDAEVCVPESQADAYQAVTPRLIVHPDTVIGLPAKRQWLLDTLPDRILVMVDDDIVRITSFVGFRTRRITDPETARAIVESAAQCAIDGGRSVFGFSQSASPRNYNPFQPFRLRMYVGGLIGFIGRKYRYDTSLRLKGDVDFCLRVLCGDKWLWLDNRYCFVGLRETNRGGTAEHRSAARVKDEIAYLQRRWGQHVHFHKSATNYKLSIRV